jgi:DNA primase (bacterial type)
MGGPPVNAKYIILAKFEVDGIAEKSDIIGAIFGQTEGMLGDDLDLRELQKIGKVGRIDVEYEVVGGKTYGTIIIPTNLDKPEVALLSAALETVDKVGPNYTKIELKEIKDLREEKRKRILERAKEILLKWKETKEVDSEELIKTLLESVRVSQIISYGEEKLPAGPEVDSSNEIIIVEGRADVVNLLKHGYKNVIALNGSKIPQTIINLSKRKNNCFCRW